MIRTAKPKKRFCLKALVFVPLPQQSGYPICKVFKIKFRFSPFDSFPLPF